MLPRKSGRDDDTCQSERFTWLQRRVYGFGQEQRLIGLPPQHIQSGFDAAERLVRQFQHCLAGYQSRAERIGDFDGERACRRFTGDLRAERQCCRWRLYGLCRGECDGRGRDRAERHHIGAEIELLDEADSCCNRNRFEWNCARFRSERELHPDKI